MLLTMAKLDDLELTLMTYADDPPTAAATLTVFELEMLTPATRE